MNTFANAVEAAARPRAVLRVPWPALLGPVPATDAEALDALALPRTLAEGRQVFERGTPARALVALVEGQVAWGWTQAPRGLSAERVLHGPAWLALAGPLGDGHHSGDALA